VLVLTSEASWMWALAAETVLQVVRTVEVTWQFLYPVLEGSWQRRGCDATETRPATTSRAITTESEDPSNETRIGIDDSKPA